MLVRLPEADHASKGAFRASVAVAALALALLKNTKGIMGLSGRGEPIKLQLTAGPDPAPAAHKAPVSEQAALDTEMIEPPLIRGRLDATQKHVCRKKVKLRRHFQIPGSCPANKSIASPSTTDVFLGLPIGSIPLRTSMASFG